MKNKNNGITPLSWAKRRPKRNKFSSPHSFLILLFVILINNAFAQVLQQRTWVVSDRMLWFSPQAAPQVAPVNKHTFSSTVKSGAVNAISDQSGNLFFYIRGYIIYDANHNVIGSLPDPGQDNLDSTVCVAGEVAIVPFVETGSCTNRYYIFYMHMDRGAKTVSLRAKIATVDIQTLAVTITDHLYGGSPTNLATSPFMPMGNYDWFGSGGLAASKEMDGKRYLYFVSGRKVQRITITNDHATNYGLSTAANLGLPYGGLFFNTTQAQLSDDGTKLAWSSGDTIGFTETRYYIIGIHATHKGWDGTVDTFVAPAGAHFSMFSARGVCFNDAGTKLFVTSGYSFSAPFSDKHGIYVYDLATGIGTLIPNTNKYGSSQLAKAANGLIYARSDHDIRGIDPTTELLVDSIPISIDADSAQSWWVKYMPDQINGEEPGNTPDLGIDMDITTTTGFDGLGDPTPLVLRIKNSLNVTGIGTKLTLKDMTVEFGEGATLNLAPGTSLDLIGCTMKALNVQQCSTANKMWRGIVANSTTDSIKIEIMDFSFIQDAYTGVDVSGSRVHLSLSGCTMQANEFGVKVSNGAYYQPNWLGVKVFNGNVPLRDQSRGSNLGYSDGLKRTIYHEYISYSNLPLEVKGVTYLGGQYGIYLEHPTRGTQIYADTFIGQKQHGVFLGHSATAQNYRIDYCTFKDQKSAIMLGGNKEVTYRIYKNNFTNISKYGIDADGNNGSSFYIGGTSLGNTFINTGWAAIYMHNNADRANTNIYIHDNTINSSIIGSKGIMISESSGGDHKFNEMRIDQNDITVLGTATDVSNPGGGISTRGIELVNVLGQNFRNPVIRDIGSYPISHINNNNIVLGVGVQALEAAASGGNNFFDNSINGNRYCIAARATNSANTLFNGNTSNAGTGLLAIGSMLYSNYYCNTFASAYKGITLRDHALRNSFFAQHGDANSGARDNNYSPKPNGKPHTGIHLENSTEAFNQWLFSTAWGLPVITSNGGGTNIFYGYEYNSCGAPGTPGGGPIGEVASQITNPVALFWEQYGRQQQYLMGYDSVPDSNANVVNLIDAENLIAIQDYTSALSIVNSLVVTPSAPDEEIMTDYKLLYRTYLAYRIADTIGRNMNDSMVAILTAIATKNPVTESPAAHSARAILWDERHLEFGNEPEPALLLTGFVNNTSCTGSITGLPAYLVDANGNIVEGPIYTDSDGQFAFDGGLVSLYENDINPYKVRIIFPNGSIIESVTGTVTELAKNGEIELTCATPMGPFYIYGTVDVNTCPGLSAEGIMAYLMKENDEIVDGPVMVSSGGTFAFNHILAALHHNSGLYKVRLVHLDASIDETTAATILDLALASPHQFNCPGEPLPKRSDKDRQLLNYKEMNNTADGNAQFSVSPNPSTGIFVIKGAGTGATATVTNLLGQTMVKDLPLTNGILDASHLEMGIYLLTVTGKHETYVRKINLIK